MSRKHPFRPAIVDRILAGEPFPNIGQITPETKRALERLVRQGALKKRRLWWPFLAWGTVQKTYYLPPWFPEVTS